MIVLFLIFWGTTILFSIVAAAICIPNNSTWGFPFLHILTDTCYLLSFWWQPLWHVSFPDGSNSKEFACHAGDPGSVPGLGKPPGEGNGNPLQYSCLENSTDRGACWALVHGMTKSRTRLSDSHSLAHCFPFIFQCRYGRHPHGFSWSQFELAVMWLPDQTFNDLVYVFWGGKSSNL